MTRPPLPPPVVRSHDTRSIEVLPIDPVLPEIVERLRGASALVIEAPPGAGKTTRVPLALLDSGLAGDGEGEVLVLEPRRLAARMAARRVAEELGEPVGERVGYSVRFDEVSGPRTRLRFATTGVALRRLLGDVGAGRSALRGVSVVVLDEFHERSLDGDLALALLRRAQRGDRPDLKLVAMSATLDAEPLAAWLGAERVRSEGRRFDVAIEYAATRDERPLEQQVSGAVRKLVADGLDGDVLVFLPGAREIRRAEEALAEVASRADLRVLSLHGDQTPAEQDRAVRRSSDGRRKVILSTNVAETSVTIDGVVAVVDSGLARIAAHDPWSGLPTLKVSRISRASATQRAGRAGRTRPGRAVRLYTRHDHDARPEFEPPEVRRQDLADTLLLLHGVGIRDPLGAPAGESDAGAIPWFEPPPVAAVEAAETLLRRLHALDATGSLTDLGRRLLRFPLHPRLGRLLVEAETRGVAGEGALLAALLGEGRRARGGPGERHVSGDSDVTALLERKPYGEQVMRAQRAIAALTKKSAARPANPDEALRIAILAGFPDRVARRRRANEADVLLAGGGTASLSPDSLVRDAELMVAVEVEERREGGAPHSQMTKPTIRLASAIEPDWLLDLYSEALRDEDEVALDARSGRVVATRRLFYDQLVLDESVLPRADPEQAARVLAEAAIAASARGQATADEPEAIARFLARLEVAAAARPGAGITLPDAAEQARALADLCIGRSSLAELREVSLVEALRHRLSPVHRELLDKLAPDRITLPSGRNARVEYLRGQAPSVASRLQDFFGATEGPRVGDKPLTLHLLAPNQRAVQVTTDLAGFWQRHYPAIRRELMRKYPKHAWPENPIQRTP